MPATVELNSVPQFDVLVQARTRMLEALASLFASKANVADLIPILNSISQKANVADINPSIAALFSQKVSAVDINPVVAALQLGKVNISDFDPVAAQAANAAAKIIAVRQAIEDRPGDNPYGFTLATSVGGDAGVLPGLPAGAVAFGSGGNVARFIGPATITAVRKTAVEPGRLYRMRFVVQRRANTADPANNAVRHRIVWLDQAGTVIGQTVIAELVSLTTASGRTEVTATFARQMGGGVDFAAPGGAVAARPQVQIFGGEPTTDVEVMSITDVTDAVVLDPVSADVVARVDALYSQDLPARLETVEVAVGTPKTRVFLTKGDAQATSVSPTVETITLIGDTASGDGRGDTFVRAAGTPTTGNFFATADGAWWVVSGVRASGAAFSRSNADRFSDAINIMDNWDGDDATFHLAWNACVAMCVTKGFGTILLPRRRAAIDVHGTLNVASHILYVLQGNLELRLADGANCDLLKTLGADALFGTNSLGGVRRFGFVGGVLTLDGNRQGNIAGRGFVIYGADWFIENLKIGGCPGDGLVSAWGPGGDGDGTNNASDIARIGDLYVSGCNGRAVIWDGPHDSSWGPSVLCESTGACNFETGPNGGALNVVRIHTHSNADRQVPVDWIVRGSVKILYAEAEGGQNTGIKLLCSGNAIMGGKVWRNNPGVNNGLVAIQIGEAATQTSPATFSGSNYIALAHCDDVGGELIKYDVESGWNRIHVSGYAGPELLTPAAVSGPVPATDLVEAYVYGAAGIRASVLQTPGNMDVKGNLNASLLGSMFGFYVAGTKVVGFRQGYIPDAIAGQELSRLNAVIAALRSHGLVDPDPPVGGP